MKLSVPLRQNIPIKLKNSSKYIGVLQRQKNFVYLHAETLETDPVAQ